MQTNNKSIPLAGAINFRDFGGYPIQTGGLVKSGMLFRAGSLSQLTDDDLPALASLGIRAVCDLRRQEETLRSPSRWCAPTVTEFYHLPFFQDQQGTGNIRQQAVEKQDAAASREIMKNLYRQMVTEPHALIQLGKVFQLLASESGVPLLVHCSGGKDRTGVTCALILKLLGVADELIMEDYLLSLELFTRRVDLNRQSSSQIYDSAKSGSLEAEALLPIYAVDADYLNSAFSTILEKYGSFQDFFNKALNLSHSDILRIRSACLV